MTIPARSACTTRSDNERDRYLTDLRRRRDDAAKAGDHAEALILNDRIRHIKNGSLSVERAMRLFDSGLARKCAHSQPRRQ